MLVQFDRLNLLLETYNKSTVPSSVSLLKERNSYKKFDQILNILRFLLLKATSFISKNHSISPKKTQFSQRYNLLIGIQHKNVMATTGTPMAITGFILLKRSLNLPSKPPPWIPYGERFKSVPGPKGGGSYQTRTILEKRCCFSCCLVLTSSNVAIVATHHGVLRFRRLLQVFTLLVLLRTCT